MATLASLGACNDLTGASDLRIGPTSSTDGAAPTPAATTDAAAPNVEDSRGAIDPSAVVSVFAPDSLDFGDGTCGVSPPPRSVAIHNQGATEITFEAVLADGTFFSVIPAKGAIASGDVGLLTVSTPGVASTGPVGAWSDKLTVTTNASGDTPHVLDVKMAIPGAIFAVSPGSINFGQLQSLPVSKTVTIRNDGNVAGTIAYEFTSNLLNSFGVSPTGSLVIAPGEVANLTVTAHPPKSGSGLRTGSVAFSSASVLCGPLPPALDLSCSRQN